MHSAETCGLTNILAFEVANKYVQIGKYAISIYNKNCKSTKISALINMTNIQTLIGQMV